MSSGLLTVDVDARPSLLSSWTSKKSVKVRYHAAPPVGVHYATVVLIQRHLANTSVAVSIWSDHLMSCVRRFYNSVNSTSCGIQSMCHVPCSYTASMNATHCGGAVFENDRSRWSASAWLECTVCVQSNPRLETYTILFVRAVIKSHFTSGREFSGQSKHVTSFPRLCSALRCCWILIKPAAFSIQ